MVATIGNNQLRAIVRNSPRTFRVYNIRVYVYFRENGRGTKLDKGYANAFIYGRRQYTWDYLDGGSVDTLSLSLSLLAERSYGELAYCHFTE